MVNFLLNLIPVKNSHLCVKIFKADFDYKRGVQICIHDSDNSDTLAIWKLDYEKIKSTKNSYSYSETLVYFFTSFLHIIWHF